MKYTCPHWSSVSFQPSRIFLSLINLATTWLCLGLSFTKLSTSLLIWTFGSTNRHFLIRSLKVLKTILCTISLSAKTFGWSQLIVNFESIFFVLKAIRLLLKRKFDVFLLWPFQAWTFEEKVNIPISNTCYGVSTDFNTDFNMNFGRKWASLWYSTWNGPLWDQ